MRSEKLMTRTVTTYNVNVMVVDTISASVRTDLYTIPESIPEKKRLDYINEKFLTEYEKAVTITDIEKVEKLYGCTESEFLSVAHELPNR